MASTSSSEPGTPIPITRRLLSPPPPPETSFLERRIEYLQQNRQASAAYVLYRLNQSLHPQNYVDEIHACTFNDGQGALLCYPLRISNVDVGTVEPLKVVAAFHEMRGREGWGDIAMISSVLEVDGTLTVDIGFTNLDDALMMWTRHGKRIKGRYWDIQPVSAVLGLAYIFRHPAPLYPLSVRLHRLSACEVVEAGITPMGELNARLSQLRLILAKLATANGEAPTSSYHLPNEPLDDTMMLYSLEGYDWAPTICHTLPKPVKKNMYMRIQSRLEHWTSDSYHDCRQGEYIRRGICYRTSKPATSSSAMKKFSRPVVSFEWKLINLPLRDLPNPSTSREMTHRERLFAQRATRWQAEIKFKAWHSAQLNLPPLPEIESDADFIDEMISLWSWYESCAMAVQFIGSAVAVRLVPDPALHIGTRVVEQSFFAADLSFGPSSRLIGVFGPDYVTIMQKVAEHRAPLHAHVATSPREGMGLDAFHYHLTYTLCQNPTTYRVPYL
jgi:hypothetical protein